jgi:putative FmdB family regulatory protein
MPIYEYKCPNGHVFEVFGRMSDPPAEVCEVCGASPVERVLYPVAVHFKGSGFYTTDYGRGSHRGSKDGSGSDSGGDSGGGGGDSGSKSSDGGSSGDTPAVKKTAEA